MSMWIDGWKKMFCWSGRADRSDYWVFHILSTILVPICFLILLGIIAFISKSSVDSGSDAMTVGSVAFSVFVTIFVSYGIVALLAGLALMIRRVHDLNLSGWLVLIGIVLPVIGWFVLLAFTFMPGTAGRNLYGEDPFEKKMKVLDAINERAS